MGLSLPVRAHLPPLSLNPALDHPDSLRNKAQRHRGQKGEGRTAEALDDSTPLLCLVDATADRPRSPGLQPPGEASVT